MMDFYSSNQRYSIGLRSALIASRILNFIFKPKTVKAANLIRDFIKEHYFYIITIIIYVSYVWLIAWHFEVTEKIMLNVYTDKFILTIFLYIFSFVIGHSIYVMLFIRPDRLFRFILNDLRSNYFTSKRILYAIPVIVLFQLFSSAYTSLKSMIPVINPYSWDSTFIRLDSFIHFGYHPWQLLQPMLGYPLITYIINFMYNLWYFIVIFFVCYQIFSLKDPKLRMQFLLAMVGVWSILGGLLASCFSSVGPCFYGNLTGHHEAYGPLMQYLYSANEKYNIYSLSTQEYLWSHFINNKMAFGSGISAMPSMHVAKIFLITLLAWRKNRTLGIVFTVYTLFILMGSVHLAWHYAVDGYLSIFLTLIVWHVAGMIARCIPLYEKPKISSIANVDLKQ